MAKADKTGCKPDEGRGYFIQTFSGIKYYPSDPRPEEIEIEDIAHSLSMMCRYNGHVSRFYSVCQHSVHTSEIVEEKHKLEALLHDAVEFAVSDLARPVKHMVPGYADLELLNHKPIAKKFGIPVQMSPEVRYADNVMLATEKLHLMKPGVDWGDLPDPLPWKSFRTWGPEEAKRRFLETYYALTGEKAA